MKLTRLILFCLSIFVLAFPVKTYAFTVRSGEQALFTKQETSQGSLFITGARVQVDGDVDGDVFCVGQHIEINGQVNGDVICAGQNVDITGTVKGDVRLAGQMVNLESSISGNVSALAQNLTISKQASVAGEVGFGVQHATFAGNIFKSVYGGGETVTVSGTVQDLDVSVDSLSLLPGASVAGNIHYTSENSATIDEQASVSGVVNKSTPKKDRARIEVGESAKSRESNRGIPFIVLSLVFGGLCIFFMKKRTTVLLQTMQQSPGLTLVRGLIFLVLIPVSLLLLLITIIGIPVVFIGIGVIILSYFIARALSAIILGLFLIERLWDAKKGHLGWSLILGVITLWALQQIPFIGGFTSLVITLYGFGGLTYLPFPKKK